MEPYPDFRHSVGFPPEGRWVSKNQGMMDIAYHLAATIWILGLATSNVSTILFVAHRLAVLFACVYALVALLTLLKNSRKIMASASQLMITNKGLHAIDYEKENDKIGRYFSEEKVTHFDSVISQFLMENKPFLRQKYSLSELASDVDIPLHYVSAFINRYYKMNYNDFINSYRVFQSKEMIIKGDWRNKKLEAIASESGFNNRNTFTVAFKKEMGKSPSEFLKEIKKGDGK
jgi:YesN/AraC family two-component response regulator